MSVMHLEEVAVLLEQHRPALLAYLGRAFHLEEADQEDLVQEVCVRAYQAIAGGKTIPQERLLPWLYRMTHNRAIDLWRHRTRLTLVPLLEGESLEEDHFDTRLIERNEINAILAQLAPALAECLLLSVVYGYSTREIARRQQVQSHLVRVRMMRARRRFAALYHKRAEPGEAETPTLS